MILALKTLLKLRHLLPSLDQRLANPNFPVNVEKHALNDLDMLDFQAESSISYSDEELKSVEESKSTS